MLVRLRAGLFFARPCCLAPLCHHVASSYAKHGSASPLWNHNMRREDALDDASARKAALAKLFQKPAAAVTEPVTMQPSVADSAELVAIARSATYYRHDGGLGCATVLPSA